MIQTELVKITLVIFLLITPILSKGESQNTIILQGLSDPKNSKVDSLLKPIISNFQYPIGIAFSDLISNHKFFYNEKELFPTASAIKIEILIHLMKEYEKRNLNLYENIQINYKVGGSGLLQFFDQSNLKLNYYNLALLMIQQSDNSATNILIQKLGMQNINQTIEELGLRNTKLQRLMMDFEARKAGKENLSTPEDKLKLLEIIYHSLFLPDSLNNEVIKILSIDKPTPLLDEFDDEFTLASKGGELSDVRCDMGIFFCKNFNYILVVMTKNLPNSKIGKDVIKNISRQIYNYMKSKY